jgi:DNA modification methylase
MTLIRKNIFDVQAFSPKQISFDLDRIRNKKYLTHNFHPYPAKFVPHFPRKIIRSLSKKGETVLDPFCGCGTTLVESKLLGRDSIGVDVNPIATLVSKVKTTILSDVQLKRVKQTISEIGMQINLHYGIKPISGGTNNCVDFKVPDFLNRDHWFKPHVQKELAIIKALIDPIDDTAARNFLEVAFSSIIIKVSNQESETRYARKDKPIKSFDVYHAFKRKVEDMLERIVRFSLQASPASVEVFNHDSKEMPFLENGQVDLIMTSPPYLNSYDYYLYHKLRMYWFGMNHYPVQEMEIGSRNKHSDNDFGVDQYLESMKKCLREMSRVLKENRYCCIVIGDAIKDGKLVKMDTLFQKIARDADFVLRKKIIYPLRKYTFSFNRGFKNLHKNGYIMIFEKELTG